MLEETFPGRSALVWGKRGVLCQQGTGFGSTGEWLSLEKSDQHPAWKDPYIYLTCAHPPTEYTDPLHYLSRGWGEKGKSIISKPKHLLHLWRPKRETTWSLFMAVVPHRLINHSKNLLKLHQFVLVSPHGIGRAEGGRWGFLLCGALSVCCGNRKFWALKPLKKQEQVCLKR